MNSYRCNIEESFRKYYGALCYFASRYVCEGGEVVEDLVQDCFVRLLEHKTAFESEEHLRNHLYVAVRNNCLNHLQKDRRTDRCLDIALTKESAPDEVAEGIFPIEVIRCLAAHIDNLPPQCRQVIRLSYVEGLDNESVAGKLGLSINTVRAQKMRGKRLLRLSFGKAVF